MKFNFLDFAAKLLVVNIVLFFVIFLILFSFMRPVEPESILTKYNFLVATMTAVNSLMMVIYPLGIIFTRIKKKSYNFIKSWWHYIAIAFTILYWVKVFLEN